MNFKFKNLFRFLLLLFVFIFISGCEYIEKDAYTLTYSAEGNGYVECEIESGTSVEKGTLVNLIAKGIGSFEGWYEDGELFDEGSDLVIRVNRDINLIAKFVGNNYTDDEYTLISDLVEGEESTICATVVALCERGYLLKDSSGYMMVYMGSNAQLDYSVNDILVITGVSQLYEGKMQFTYNSINEIKKVDVSRETLSIEEVGSTYLESFMSNVEYGKYVRFNASLASESSNGKVYYNFYPSASDVCVYSYYPYSSMLSSYSGQQVIVEGFLWSLYNRVYIVVTDVSTASGSNQDFDNTLCVLYNEDFKDVQVSFDGGGKKKMELKDGFYTIGISGRPSKVKFYSGTESTVELELDLEQTIFVLGEKNFNGKYSGYFTTIDDVSNEVKKVTSLSMNDIHGYIMQNSSGKGGLSNASYIVNQIRNENSDDDIILLGNGDMFQGTAISNLKYGHAVIDAMNAMEFDFLGIGNHEFDWGIEKIFEYFDGDQSNGEANFPLVNSNIVYSSDGKLVLIDGYNICQSLMLEKNGLKIGVVSCIGDVYSSILYSKTRDYLFNPVVKATEQLAKSLKDQGADMILVNIHDGNADDIKSYSANTQLAQLKYNGKYLIDIVINGHTHTKQLAYIERSGANMPVIQCAGNGENIGEIELYYDTVSEELTYSYACHYDVLFTASNNYDVNVQNVIDEHYASIKHIIDEVYCVSSETISDRSQLYDWSANVMIAAVGADISISNNGGIRSTGGIYNGTKITIEHLYEINPFDNEIIIVEVPGKVIANFLRKSSIYYGLKDGLSLSKLQNDNSIYKVAVIDYVYYWNDFPNTYESTETDVILRDAMVEDLRLRTSFNPSVDSSAFVGNLFIN